MAYSPIIIGLVAPSGGGKTSVCDYIQSLGFAKIHAAGPLKRAFCAMFVCPATYTERPLIETPAEFLGGVEPRDFLEQIGDRIHEVAPQALPFQLNKKLTNMKRLSKPWILVDGIRRKTESDVVHSHGGKVIRIEGKPIDPRKPCDRTQLDVDHDYLVQFSPTLEGLHEQLDQVLVELFPPGMLEDAKRK